MKKSIRAFTFIHYYLKQQPEVTGLLCYCGGLPIFIMKIVNGQ